MSVLYNYLWGAFTSLGSNKFDAVKLYDVIDANIAGLENILPSSTQVVFQFSASISANEKAMLDSYVANHTGRASDFNDDFARNSKGILLTSPVKPEGKKLNIFTPNLADKRTWYWKAIRRADSVLQHVSGSNYTAYVGTGAAFGVWIDNAHGRYTKEDQLKTEEGYIPRLKVYVNGVEKTERKFGANSGGDFYVDYLNSKVIFYTPLTAQDVVTADVYVENGSLFVIRSIPNSSIFIDDVKVQFSVSASQQDTVIFDAWMTDPNNPSGAKIPIPDSANIYKSMQDFINECSGSYPQIQKTTNPSPSERDLPENQIVYMWDYKTETPVSDAVAAGFELRVRLENDIPYKVENDRSSVVATFYCRVS